MEKHCQNPLCRAEAVTEVSVSIHKPADQRRALCAACLEVYAWGMEHASRARRGLVIEPPPKEKGPEPLYRVAYLIDVNAAGVQDAAACTHRIMTDSSSLAPVLHILDHKGRDTIVDLAAEPPAENQCGAAAGQGKARQFVQTGGTQCPQCHSSDLDCEAVELDELCAYQEIRCRNCQLQFYAVYRLAGYGLRVGDSFEVAGECGESQGPAG
jgi:hypothetical protein